ncbi:toll/interleukin-1 receptor domain-containing protein [Saccharophagus degradans]|uniref:toll/interleukin-1 receptor domain-containing protein n=1 Tax=Saccharophagus degradans TaxID=86304 RepID=UPI001C08275A|nr:toll/interleukin-1 receptor domain-containing protein [Saccharophagus degradans]MBU2984890.1 toll/interleukin-1 receptor domain-containing protein [Saccharophagus degradans]
MAILRKSKLIKDYESSQSNILEKSAEKKWAGETLKKVFDSFSHDENYDIFLSHSYQDARIVKHIRDMLVAKNYKVYVDWLEDKHLERGEVTGHTATVLRNRMNRCGSLIYLTSSAAEASVWMPWELGYMDAKTGRVAVAPILEDDEDEEFAGREYLGIYPYLDLSGDSFFIQRSKDKYIDFPRWMAGENP